MDGVVFGACEDWGFVVRFVVNFMWGWVVLVDFFEKRFFVIMIYIMYEF